MVKQSAIRLLDFDRTILFPLALVIAILAMATTGFGAAAQEPNIDFRILKINCEEDPGLFPEGEIPEGCTPVEGVEFSILVEGETESLVCTTNADGRCLVQVESESFVTVTEDESTATDGFAPLENPIETQAVSEFAGAVFVNVREATDLPDTGSGASVRDMSPGPAGTLAVVATVLAMSGLLVISLAGSRLMRVRCHRA
jgi:hypothetical protein